MSFRQSCIIKPVLNLHQYILKLFSKIIARNFRSKKEKCSTQAINESGDELSYVTQSQQSLGTYSDEKERKCRVKKDESEFASSDFELKSYQKKKFQNDLLLNELNEKQRESISRKQHEPGSFATSLCINSFGKLLLETGVYVAALRQSEGLVCRANKCLNEKPCDISLCSAGDRILSINGILLANKPIHDIVDLFKNCEYFDLVIQKEIFSLKEKQQRVSSSNYIDLTRSQTISLLESASENHSFSKPSEVNLRSHHKMVQPQQLLHQHQLMDSDESVKFFDSRGNLISKDTLDFKDSDESDRHNNNLKAKQTKQFKYESHINASKPLNAANFYSDENV